jgi:hypothetical protein
VTLLKTYKKMWENQIPFGKLTQNYGKSPFSMGKSTFYGLFQ